ncbi:MAG: type I-E CRISPR-associated protein Cse1/CasA, partial [Paracoccaceae bacterium]
MLNLITDAWIPIITRAGARRVIAPAHMTDPDMWRPDWPRADLNIACLELLIGLAYMSCPCADLPSWRRSAATPPDMHNSLAPYAHAFELLGDGPRFLQDLEPLDGSPAPPDMLFIDSAGGNTAKNNADLAVHRDRYAALDLPLAAMALYTLQAHAPSGGAGNRTSMRGGGPLVTLIEPSPDCTLWDMIWANVPYGTPAKPKDLPWMRATRTSKAKGTEVTPPGNLPYSIEAFFGMPRRLRLMATQDQITGVIQKPYGTNYALWKHPLSPHYRLKSTTEWLPKHPKPGQFGYRNWLGIVSEAKNTDVAERAWIVSEAETRF